MRSASTSRILAVGALFLLAAASLAQRFRGRGGEEGPAPVFPVTGEFHFIRLEYTDLPQYHRRFGFASRAASGEGWWMVDWPDSDNHFTLGLGRLTRIDVGEPRHYRLTDNQLF